MIDISDVRGKKSLIEEIKNFLDMGGQLLEGGIRTFMEHRVRELEEELEILKTRTICTDGKCEV